MVRNITVEEMREKIVVRMEGSLDYDGTNLQTTFENGEIAYWYSGNGFGILYDNTVENSEVSTGVIVFGKIASDLTDFMTRQTQQRWL